MACLYDSFSFGPIGSGDEERIRWLEDEIGGSEWELLVAHTSTFLHQSLANGITPVVWISRRDAQVYAGFLWWLSRLRDRPCKVIDVTDVRLGELAQPGSARLAVSPSLLPQKDLVCLLDSEKDLGPEERATAQARWEQLEAENAPLRVIDANGALVSAPIDHFDPLILACATTEWRKMAHVLGVAIGSFWDDEIYQTGDLVLAARAWALVQAGALEWRGDLWSMKDCELRRPS